MLKDKQTLSRKDFILKHINLSRYAAHQYIAKVPGKRDEILSAAYLGMVLAVKRIYSDSVSHDNLQSFIWQTVCGTIKDSLTKDTLIKTPKDEGHVSTVPISEIKKCVIDHDPLIVEDILKFLRLTNQEKLILDLRIDGYTFAEIGKIVGCAASTAKLRLTQMQQRLKKY